MYGAGPLGTCAIAILRALYPDVEVAVVARFDAQAQLAEKLGATGVPARAEQLALIEELAEWSGGGLRPTMGGLPGLPMCHPGGIDVVYDTVGKPETFEVGVRVLKARGTLVQIGRARSRAAGSGVPLYFKEIRWVGSNAFGIEEVEGNRQHGIGHYLDLVAGGRIDLTGMLTHTFPLDEWRDAFATIADPGRDRRHQGRDRPTRAELRVTLAGPAGQPRRRDRRRVGCRTHAPARSRRLAGARLAAPGFTVQCPPGDNLAIHVAVVAAPPGSALVVQVDGIPERGLLGRGADHRS